MVSYICNEVDEKLNNSKFSITNGSTTNSYAEGKPSGKGSYDEENQLECSLEEIKQLISTTSIYNNFFHDENRTDMNL